MTRPPFHADHVGSLLRPPELREARAKAKAGELGATQLRSIEDACIVRAVKKQEEIGLQSITDGEFRREKYFTHFAQAVDGFGRAEGTVTYANAPARGTLLGSLGAVSSGATYTVDVTKGVSTLNGEIGFRVDEMLRRTTVERDLHVRCDLHRSEPRVAVLVAQEVSELQDQFRPRRHRPCLPRRERAAELCRIDEGRDPQTLFVHPQIVRSDDAIVLVDAHALSAPAPSRFTVSCTT